MNAFQIIDDNDYLWNNITVPNENPEPELKARYKTPGDPTAFANTNTIVRHYNHTLNPSYIDRILSSIESKSLHKEFHKGPRNISYSRFKRYQFQIDLCFLQDLATYNDNIKYLLTVIDTFTRFAFVEPLQEKNANSVLLAFRRIIDPLTEKPYTIVCDKGTEFINREFKRYCNDLNIKLITPQSNIHASFVERFNRTLQNLIRRFLTEYQTNRYIDELQNIVLSYNLRFHRMIEMSPYEAENNENAELHINNLLSLKDSKIKKQIPKYKIGDKVRIALEKNTFTRGYDQKASNEIFTIDNINLKTKIPLYYLKAANGETIQGGFYSFELAPTNIEVFRIERILRRRQLNGVNQVFVKWLGYGNEFNQWINEADLENVDNI